MCEHFYVLFTSYPFIIAIGLPSIFNLYFSYTQRSYALPMVQTSYRILYIIESIAMAMTSFKNPWPWCWCGFFCLRFVCWVLGNVTWCDDAASRTVDHRFSCWLRRPDKTRFSEFLIRLPSCFVYLVLLLCVRVQHTKVLRSISGFPYIQCKIYATLVVILTIFWILSRNFPVLCERAPARIHLHFVQQIINFISPNRLVWHLANVNRAMRAWNM